MTAYKRKTKGMLLILLVLLTLMASVCCVGVSAEEEYKTYEYGYFKYTVQDSSVCITEYTGEGGDVSIPNLINDMTVIAIGDEAFWYRSDVTAVDLPDYLEYIGKRAFQGCTSLKTISIPNSVCEISDAAFCDCTSLVSLNVPSQLIYVGGSAFDNTPWITKFDNNKSIIFGGKAFYKYLGDAEVVTIPKGVTGISSNAFVGNKTLKYVSIPDSVVFIGDYCFLDCPSLKEVSIPDNVYYMGAYSFGYTGLNQKDSEAVVEGFTIYADKDTLGQKYAAEYELECKPRAKHATPYELPTAETCTAGEIDSSFVPSAENAQKDKGVNLGGGRGVALIIILASCVLIGGVYVYFTYQEKQKKKKNKARREAAAKRRNSQNR